MLHIDVLSGDAKIGESRPEAIKQRKKIDGSCDDEKSGWHDIIYMSLYATLYTFQTRRLYPLVPQASCMDLDNLQCQN